jgi:S-adenosylmethionine:diacylglycerol 3-amino-3-carboxypropyl transferase
MNTNRNVLADGGTQSKISRSIEKYGLEGLGEEIETRWLATDERAMSTRELAEYFNKQVLESALERSELSLLDVDIDAVYSRLTDDDVSAGERTRMERRLDRSGIDLDAVTGDFVTHQTVYTYLTKHREVSQPEEGPDEKRAKAVERIQKLQNRTAAVTADTIETLQREDLVPGGEFDVLVDVQIVFEDGKQLSISDLVEE